MSICQLQKKSISLLIPTFSLIYLIGCAETPVEPIKPTEKKMITADWFKLPPRFASIEKDETLSIHPFFDIAWKAEDYEDWGSGKSFKLPYFVTTPIDSDAQYEFDMYSGKIYRERMFCPQDDVWKNYNSNLEKPNFTQGIIPRVYNELQKPQQVILFSSENFKPYFEKSIKSYADVKVIGSLILESCEIYPCDIKERWKTSQIL
ncbi:MAG: hypothetical protein K2Q18_13435, partial [Bdellovibrionales bacterium]|nr:hypothetical protein [Bdellovibrionales bacterium]